MSAWASPLVRACRRLSVKTRSGVRAEIAASPSDESRLHCSGGRTDLINFWTYKCAVVADVGGPQNMRHFSVWLIELFKLVGGRRLHPLRTQCPICQQMVRLHVNKAGRRHIFAHARALFEGSRFSVHYSARKKCAGSGSQMLFDPRPNEQQRFKLPHMLLEK